MAALNFPADPAAQSPANTFSPTSSPDATTNGATYIWNGTAWTGYVEGAAQYWARAGAVLTPLNSGDSVTIGPSADIQLFASGSIVASDGVKVGGTSTVPNVWLKNKFRQIDQINQEILNNQIQEPEYITEYE